MNTYIKGRITKGEFVSELFKQRVESLGGTCEANDCLVNSLNSLTDKKFKDAKLILTPNGYVVDKLPTIKPNGGGDATVTRNVTKTRVNSSGLIESMPANVLAPDYLNGVCPALNVEGQATNLITYSEDFSNVFWRIDGSPQLTINNEISPRGNLTASTITSTNDAGFENFKSSAVPYTNNTSYVASAFIKKTNNTNYAGLGITIQNTNSKVFYLIINTLTGEVNIAPSSNLTPTINDVKLVNGFYRISASYTDSSTNNEQRILLYPAISLNGTSISKTATGSSVFFGAEIKNNDSSYIYTNGSQVTRSADTVTIPIPAGVTEIIEKYEDGTTNTITTIPASPYTVPVGRYEYILMR